MKRNLLPLAAMLLFFTTPLAALAQTPAATPATTNTALQTGEKVDINVADQATLERLPGVGPKLAQAIIQHRTNNGEFVLPADVMKVPGIREGRFAQIKTWISADEAGTMLYTTDTKAKPTTTPRR